MKQPDLMAKLKAFEAAHPRVTGPVCSVCRLPADVRAFVAKAREAGSTFRTIAAVLAGEGHKVSTYTVGRHHREHVQG
jgi:hypothetical protein